MIEQVNMGWDEDRQRTVLQRSKESSEDYRYFPEPDLPPLVVDRQWVEETARTLPELPDAKEQRYRQDWSLRPADAGAITGEKAVADYFEAAVAAYGQDDGKPQRMANWITDELFRLLYADGEGQDLRQIADTRVQPQQLAALVQMVDAREINANTGKKVLEQMYSSGDDPQAVVEREGLAMVSNTDVIDAAVQEAFDSNPDELARYRSGEKKLFGFFMGQMMRATKGKADPQAARQRLQEMLDSS